MIKKIFNLIINITHIYGAEHLIFCPPWITLNLFEGIQTSQRIKL